MEIENVKQELERFKNDYEAVLNDFNERTGNSELKKLTERARKTYSIRHNIPLDREIPILLAIGDLIQKFIDSGILNVIHDFAENKDWKCSISEFAGWEDDSSKLKDLKGEPDLSSYFTFDCQNKISNYIYTPCPIIDIYKDENEEYKAMFNLNSVVERIEHMDE